MNIELIQGLSIKPTHRKSKHYTGGVIALVGTIPNLKTVIEVRTYEASSTAYVCVWVQFNGIHTSASEAVNGWGFSRKNCAIALAARKIGFVVSEGADASSQVEVMMKQLGVNDFQIIETYA